MSRYYVSTAESLVAGRGFADGYEYNFIPPPMQALFLAGIKLLVPGADFETMRLAQALISIATLPLVFALGSAMGGPLVGALAAVLVAIDPDVIGLVSTLLAETNYFFLLFAFLLVLLTALRRDAARWFAGAGLVLGLTCLTKPFPMLLWLVVPGWIALHGRNRHALVCAGVFCAAFALVVAPWTARNALHYHGFYPISTNAGVLLAQSNFAELDSTQPRMVYWEDVRRLPGWRDPGIDARYANLRDADGKREWNQLDRDYERHALHYIAQHPLHFLRNYFAKLYNVLFYPGRYAPPSRLRYAVLGATWPFPAFRPLLVLLGLAGWLWFATSTRGRPEWFMTIVCAYFVLFAALLHITRDGRINLPLKLLLTLFAAYVLGRLLERPARALHWAGHKRLRSRKPD